MLRRCAVVLVVLSLLRVFLPVEVCRLPLRGAVYVKMWPWQAFEGAGCWDFASPHVPLTVLQAVALAAVGVALWGIGRQSGR